MEAILVSAKEAARSLMMDNNEFYHKLESGEIPAFKEGRNWKIPVRLLQEYAESRARRESDIRQDMKLEEDNGVSD